MKNPLHIFHRRRREAEWQEEIDSHRALRSDFHGSQAAAQRGSLRTVEAIREVHVRPWADALLLDLRHAARGIRRSPGFALVAVATLAVGIGAATAVFSVVDRLLFRGLPYPRADRLVSIGFQAPLDSNEFNIGPAYLDWRDRQTAFTSITAMRAGADLCDLGEAPPQRLHCYLVGANFLPTLEIKPAEGRNFLPEEDRPNAPRTALLSNGLWRSRFGGSAAVVGSVILLNERPVRVIGVLPPEFEMPQLGSADILLPAQIDERVARAPNSTLFLRSFARLKDGVSISAARQAMMPLFEESVRGDVPAELRREVRLVVRSLRDRQIQDARLASWLLFASVLTLMALACANLANLLLARGAVRAKEMAMRAALGAGRARLALQLLVESLTLSALGCAAGCALAWVMLRALIAISPDAITRLDQARVDGRVLLFAIAISLVAALATGLLPAWARLRGDLLAGWRSAGDARSWTRQALVGAQVALSLVLLTGASLLVRSLWNLEAEPLGFQASKLVTATFTLNARRYNTPEKTNAFYAALEQRLAQNPGGASVALSDSLPPSGGTRGRPYSNIRVAGHPPLAQNGGYVAFRYVTPGYFRTMGIPIVQGRGFTEDERSADQTPVILSATLARRMFGDENPVGQRLDLDGDQRWAPVVGVAADVKNSGIGVPASPEYYRLRTTRSTSLGSAGVAILRTSLAKNAVAAWLRQQIATVDAYLPVTIDTMQTRVDRLSERPRFLAALTGLFAVFGLILAAVGLYGVLSFLVAQRTREIGVRMALGATPGGIALMMQGQAGKWTAAGIAVGLAGSAAVMRLAQGALFHVSPYDPSSLAAAIALLAGVAALAAWLPARRASGVDPAASLRDDN
jgi:putative ABC transport system permease protein